jgi:hypothetical protein
MGSARILASVGIAEVDGVVVYPGEWMVVVEDVEDDAVVTMTY